MRLRVLILALISSALFAQSFTPVREQKNLSPSTLAKLHTLETLNALPGGDWRFHAGDLPHAESPALDDSAWPIVPAPTSRATYVKAPKDAVWYRRTITVPATLHGYDISGSRIWFQFRADANGPMPEIIYFNGRRVALGDDLEPIVLFEPAHPGDHILVAVKLLHTVDTKTFTGVNLRIEPIEASRPNPEDLRQQIVAAANLLPTLPTPRRDLLPVVEQAAAAIDLTALAAGNQHAFDASLRHAQAILAPLHAVLAQDKIDLAGNSHIDAAWLWPRSETIDVVKRTFTTALQLMNEYPDYTFTQSAAQYSAWMADKYPELNAQIAQRVKEGRWQIVGGMWVEPDLNLPGGESLVRQLLVGQREFQQLYGVTARIGWNPDSFGYNWQLPQIYKRSGMDYFVTQKMHWNDTNQLPFRLFWWQSPDGSRVLTYFPTDYVHDNVNPTRLSADMAESQQRNPGLTEHLDLFGIGDHGGGPTRAMLDSADHWIALSEGLGSRGQGLESGSSSTLNPKPSTLNPAPLPTIRYGTPQAFFTDVETHLNPNSPTWNYDSIARGYTPPPLTTPNPQLQTVNRTLSSGLIGIPTWRDELYLEYHRGIFTSQANHKRNMRTSETQTLDAEKLASLAWLLDTKGGAPYPADILTDNWKKITFNQFHDLAAGSGIAVIYRDAQQDFTEVANANRLIDQSALNALDAQINTTVKGGVPVIIYNSLAWPRNTTLLLTAQLPDAADAVQWFDEYGKPVLSQAISSNPATHEFKSLVPVTVSATGYAVLHAEAILPRQQARNTLDGMALHLQDEPASFNLSNTRLQFTLDKKTGCITALDSLKNIYIADKGTHFLASNACGNQLQTYADNPKQYDAWNIDPGTLDGKMTPIDTLDSIKVVADGPLRKTIEIKRTWSKSHFTQDISLDADSDFVRVDTTVDWHEDHVLLKAAFPLAHSGPKATYEIPYGSIQRPTTRNNTWEKAQFEVPALRWADLGDSTAGVSILNDSKYGYDALGNTLRLTLLRSPTWPDPDADRGPQHFTYEIYPHTGPWQQAETVHRGYELNTPLLASQVFSHTGSLPSTHSFVSVAEPNITLTAIKKAEDAHALIFRFYEWAGKDTTLHLQIPPGATAVRETNLMETPIPNAPNLPLTHTPGANDTVTLPVHPYEIRTLEALYPPEVAIPKR
jgi:alpha-mannosidase